MVLELGDVEAFEAHTHYEVSLDDVNVMTTGELTPAKKLQRTWKNGKWNYTGITTTLGTNISKKGTNDSAGKGGKDGTVTRLLPDIQLRKEIWEGVTVTFTVQSMVTYPNTILRCRHSQAGDRIIVKGDETLLRRWWDKTGIVLQGVVDKVHKNKLVVMADTVVPVEETLATVTKDNTIAMGTWYISGHEQTKKEAQHIMDRGCCWCGTIHPLHDWHKVTYVDSLGEYLCPNCVKDPDVHEYLLGELKC